MKPTQVIGIFLSAILLYSCDVSSDRSEKEADDGGANNQLFSKNIQAPNVKSVTANIDMAAGELVVEGGAKDLVEMAAEYGEDSWKPNIDFSDEGETGKFTVDQEDVSVNLKDDIGGKKNNWNIRLNDRVKQNIYCRIGAGETQFLLQGFPLEAIHIDAGVGEHTFDLRDTSVPEIEVNAGIGQVNIDLSGTWTSNLKAEINGGIGQLNLKLPEDVGIRMEVKGGLGEIKAPNLQKDGRVYTNDLYQKADHYLDFIVKAGLGEINVELIP